MKPAKPRILSINGGSSSIKFALYQGGAALKRGLYGKVDRIGLSGTKNSALKKPVGSVPSSGRPCSEATMVTSGKVRRI